MLGVCADRHRKWAFHRGATRTSRRGTIFSDRRRDLAWPLPIGSQRPCIYWSVNWFVSFVLIFDPLRQVITSSRVSSRIRAQGLSHHADRARGNLAAKRPGEPRRWQLPTPPRLSTHDDLHDVSRGRGTRHSHWPCALRLARWATAPDREMRVYATKSGLDAPVYRASVPVRRHTRPTAWLPRTKPPSPSP